MLNDISLWFCLHIFKLMILNTFSCMCWPFVWLLLRNVNNLPVLRDNSPNLRKLCPPLENHQHVFHQVKGFCVALPSEISTTMKTIQFYFVWFPDSSYIWNILSSCHTWFSGDLVCPARPPRGRPVMGTLSRLT